MQRNQKTEENMETKFRQVAEEVKRMAAGSQYVKRINVDEKPSGLCPYLQFVRYDALNKEDVPHNIDENSVYITFEINHNTNKVEVFSNGHVWLSEEDKKSERYKYYAMKSIQQVLVDNGGKKFRKSSFKNVSDLCKKMQTYFDTVMKEVECYSGGYPYKA